MIKPQILTERQQEVLALMLERHNHRQIARALGLTTHTVQYHMIQIWDRLCQPRNAWYALHILRTLHKKYSARSVSRPVSPHSDGGRQ